MKRSTKQHTRQVLWLTAILAGLLLLPLVAQASSSTGGGSQPWARNDGPRPAEVVSSMKFVVHEVSNDRTLVLIDEDQERPHRIQLSEDVPLTAKSKKDFEGRKDLDFGDLAVGQRLKVTFSADSGKIIRVKILETTRSS